jgi:hypothetical protein
MYAGDHVMVFMARGPLYLVAIASSGEVRRVHQGEGLCLGSVGGGHDSDPKLIYVSSSQPASVLKRQLEWLHLQIISTITSGITKIFETRPCFDLRSLLRGPSRVRHRRSLFWLILTRGCVVVSSPGSTKFIDNLVEGMDKQPSYLLNATQCLPLEPAIRSVTGTYLQGVKSEDLVYVSSSSHSEYPLTFFMTRSRSLHPLRS